MVFNEGTKCFAITLLIYNAFILVLGYAALGLGIWQLRADFGSGHVTTIVGSQLYEVATYLLIAGGGAVAFTAVLGCYGTIRENKYVLSFYGIMVAISLIVFGVATGMAFFFREKFGCCGVSGNGRSVESWAYYSTYSSWYMDSLTRNAKQLMVPPSCCTSEANVSICTGQVYFPGPPHHLNSPLKKLSKTNAFLYTTGCYDILLPYMKWHSLVAGIASACMLLFLIFGIILFFVFCIRVTGGSSVVHEPEIETPTSPGELTVPNIYIHM